MSTFITSNIVKVIADNALPHWLKIGDIVRIIDTMAESGLHLISNGSQTYWLYDSEIELASAEEVAATKNDSNKLLNDFRAFQKENI